MNSNENIAMLYVYQISVTKFQQKLKMIKLFKYLPKSSFFIRKLLQILRTTTHIDTCYCKSVVLQVILY